jgi:hypothetical protein
VFHNSISSENIIYSSYDIVICRPISRQRPKYAYATIVKVIQGLFSIWSAPCSLLGNIPTESDAWNGSNFGQPCGKQALSAIYAVFSVRSVQSGYKGV